MPADNCYVFGIGIDPFLTDFGLEGRVYVADGAPLAQKVRIVPIGGLITDFATGFTFGTAPRGIVVDRNSTSSFFHHVFVSDSTAVRRYDSAVPGNLLKTYNSANSPVASPRQMAITTSPRERLLIADDSQNRIVMINPATDKTKTIDIPLSGPRGIALDQDAGGKTFAYVAEPTRVLKFPIYKTVFIAPWIAEGSGMASVLVRRQIERANRALEPCGIELKIRNDTINFFTPGALLDLEITDWTLGTSSCANPALQRSPEEAVLLNNAAFRSAEPTDLNIYFVRSFTGPAATGTTAETVTADCFSDVTDTTNSGIIFSVQQLTQFRRDSIRTVAHEIGHALLDRLSWASGDEHKNQVGTAYTVPWSAPHFS